MAPAAMQAAPMLTNVFGVWPSPTPINNNNLPLPTAVGEDAAAPFAEAVKPDATTTATATASPEESATAAALQAQQLQYQQMAVTNQALFQQPNATNPQAAQAMFAAFMQTHQQAAAAAATAAAPDAAATTAASVNDPAAAAAVTVGTVTSAQFPRPTYVNAKQFHRILKRRETRAVLQEHYRKQVDEKEKKAYQHESRHQHAMKRPRGKHGRFLRKEELPAYYLEHPDEDPSNPENLARMQREAEEAEANKRQKAEAAG